MTNPSHNVGAEYRIRGPGCRARARGKVSEKSQRSASGVKSGAGSQLATGVKSLWAGPYSGQTAGSGSEAWVRSQTSRPYPGPECRVRVRVRESRTGAWSTVRAIPRARVQGHDQGLGHSNSEGSGVRSQRSGPYSAYSKLKHPQPYGTTPMG